jgi:hypothetical protein
MLWLKSLGRRLVGWRSRECRCGIKTNCCQATLWRMLIRASSSWLSVMVFPRVLSGSSLKTVCSGLMCRSTIQRSFIDSLCEDVLPEERFHRLYSSGPSHVPTHWAFLRLDCEASRARLRAVYERIGIRFHSNKQVGPYFVARYEYDVTEILPSTRKPK